MSELERVCEWNSLAGNSVETQNSLFTHKIQSQLSFIEEEFNELLDAFADDDKTEVVDALGDLLVVVSGMLYLMKINPEYLLKIINDSNFSKFIDPDNTEDIAKTISKYAGDSRYKDVYVNDQGVVKGVVKETGSLKILKGCNYREPDIKEVLS